MSTKPELIKRGRSLILCGCLCVLLLPILLFVPQLALPQTPRVPPPRRDLPRGPLSPVRTISINSSYLLCNSLQLQSARRVVWEPVLSSLGATLRELDGYGLALDNAATEVCAGRLDSPLMSSAFGDLDKVMSGVEDRLFGRSLLTSDERIKLSSALLQAAYDEFQSRCFDNRVKEAELMIGRLPKTPDVGLGVEMQPASAALGRCNPSSGGKAGTGIDIAFAQNQFQACAAKVLSNASQDCTDPAGQDRSPTTPRPTTEHDTGWQPLAGRPGWEERDYRANAPDGTHKDVRQFRGPDGEFTFTHQYDAEGHLTDLTLEVVGAKFLLHYPANPTRSGERPRDSGARRRYDAETRRVNGATQRDLDKLDTAVGAALRVPPSLADRPDSFVHIPPGPAGPAHQCQAMTNSSTGRMGLLRPQSAEGVEGSGGREFISGPDLVLRCLCAFGSRGAQLANQIARAVGAPGVSCSNNEWVRRVDCVANPRGSADQIRPECLRYLRADYPFDTPQTACDAAIQCPEDSHPVVVGTPESPACRCSKGSSAGGPRPGFNCSLVRCPPPGTPSLDPAVQACCGVPGEGSGTPSGGPPRPPKPDPGGKKDSSGGEKKNSDEKKDGPGVIPPGSVMFPKLILADDLMRGAAVSGGKLQLSSLPSSKGPEAKLLIWSAVSSGDQLTLSFDFSIQASVSLYLSALRGPQTGSLRVLVNGQELGGPVDLNFQRETTAKLLLGRVELRPGANTITLVATPVKGGAQMLVSLLAVTLDK